MFKKYFLSIVTVVALLISISSGTREVLGAREDASDLGEVVVTGTREKQAKYETPATVDVVDKEEIRDTRPGHPSEIMGRVPGVHVNVTFGEGHMTAIRQPLTTSPVYLFLEDGIPTRSTGFFNHNALYEVNVPQAGGIEVTKGPGTALYGSDAIGGVINVLTRPAPLSPEVETTFEAGEHDWYRALVTGGATLDTFGFRGDVNVTHSGGWRDNSEYDRQSATLRVDRFFDSGALLKTVAAFSNINQEPAGSSRISEDDYNKNPERNYTPISFRDVKAFRLSTAYEKEAGDTLISFIPYIRYNDMDILPNWSLSYDPSVYSSGHKSIGLMTKYRRNFKPYRSRVIAGLDYDYSPGYRDEKKITPAKTGKIFTSFSTGDKIYDYDVAFQGISPYLHGEMSPVENLRLIAGLRYDHLGYDYDNNLDTVSTGKHRRPGDTTVSYDHLSPKAGFTYTFNSYLNVFASYSHAFRAPSESQLFRQGQAENTVDLEPVKADSYEAGLRGSAFSRLNYEASYYYMTKKDDIVSFRNTVDGTRETQNAGETLHRGIEIGIGAEIFTGLNLNVSYSYAKHTYEDWSPMTGVDYDGNEISSAPREIVNTRLRYTPAVFNGGGAELEWVHLDEYWMDDENTRKYEGHDLLNLRVNYNVTRNLEIFARVLNLTDEQYAEAASFSQFSGEEFAPGAPRTFYGGLTYKWGGA